MHNNSPVVTELDDNAYTDDGCGVCVFTTATRREKKKERKRREYVNTPATNTQAWRKHPQFYNAPHTHRALFSEKSTPDQLSVSRDKDL